MWQTCDVLKFNDCKNDDETEKHNGHKAQADYERSLVLYLLLLSEIVITLRKMNIKFLIIAIFHF